MANCTYSAIINIPAGTVPVDSYPYLPLVMYFSDSTQIQASTHYFISDSGEFFVQLVADNSAAQIVATMISKGANSATCTIEYDGGEFITVTTVAVFPDSGSYILLESNDNGDGVVVSAFSNSCLPLVNPITLIQCEHCLDLTIPGCPDSFTIIAGLTVGTDYTVVITDKNDKRHVEQCTADGSGNLTFDCTGFPRYFFTPESGKKALTIFTDATLSTPVLITQGATQYTCMTLTFSYVVTYTNSMPPVFEYLVDDNYEFIVDDSTNTFIVSA